MKFSTDMKSLKKIEENWGLTWGYHNGLLTNKEIKYIQSKVAETYKLGYNNAKYHAVELENNRAVVFTGNYKNPNIVFIIQSNGLMPDIIQTAKEILEYGRSEESQRFCSTLYETQNVNVFYEQNFKFDDWKDSRGKRTNSGGVNQENRKWRDIGNGIKQYDISRAEANPPAFSTPDKRSSTDAEYIDLAQDPVKNEERLREMVENAAKEAGYSENSDYQGTSAFNGSAPSSNGFYETKAERIEAWENGYFEDTQTLGDYIFNDIDINDLDFVALDERCYRSADAERKEAIQNIRNAIKNKSANITMYRSVPENVKESRFRNGDWITPSRSYAIENAEIHGWGNDYRIIEQDVSVENIWWDGNDIAEWGYDDSKAYKYKNTENNIKSADLVTYDDNGNIIPLSERFNENNEDIRYSTEKDFSQQVDDVLNGKHNPRLDLYVSQTPKYLIDLNFQNNVLLMRNSKIKEILDKHADMNADFIKGIPSALQNPILVLKSKTHPTDSVVVITDIQTSNGDMIIPVWVSQEGNYIDVDLSEKSTLTNFVASSYGRKTKGLIEYAIENDGVLFQSQDTKKVRNLLARNGLQLPTPLKISNSDIIIRQKPAVSQAKNEKIYKSTDEDRRYSLNGIDPRDMTDKEIAEEFVTLAEQKDGKRELKELISDFREGVNSGKITSKNFDSKAEKIINHLVTHFDNRRDDEAQKTLNDIRNMHIRIKLSDIQRKEAENIYGSLKDFRVRFMGYITMANDGVLLDIQYHFARRMKNEKLAFGKDRKYRYEIERIENRWKDCYKESIRNYEENVKRDAEARDDVKFSTDMQSLKKIEENWGLTWGYHNGLLTNKEIKYIQSKVAETYKLGYNNAKYHAVELENNRAVVFTGNYENPQIIMIINSNDFGDDLLGLVKEILKYDSSEESQRFCSTLYAEKNVNVFYEQNFKFNDWKDGRGKRTNSGGVNQENRKWRDIGNGIKQYDISRAEANTPAFSTPDKRSSTDAEYLDLAQDPVKNEARLREMVEAQAKAHGYNSPILYHGTDKFGFTRFDLSKMDDNTSIFTTSSSDMAGSYANLSKIRRINENYSDMSSEEIKQALEEDYYWGKSKINLLKAGDIQSRYDLIKPLLKKAVEDYIFRTNMSAEDVRSLYDAWKEFENNPSVETARYLNLEMPSAEYRSDFRPTKYMADVKRLLQLFDKENIDKDMFYMDEALYTKEAARSRIRNIYAGIYQLYGKTNNQLVIDGKGARWNEIEILDYLNTPFGESIKADYGDEYFDKSHSDVTTRIIAEYAKKAGYDSVLIKNIFDDGGQSQKNPDAGDVYIYFNPNDVKSADLVTYDDNGNIIPLSERFNEDNEDIRYSISEDAEKHIDIALNQKEYTEDIYLTKHSPSIIASQKGARDLPMLMNASHIRENILTESEAKEKGLKVDKSTHYHGLGKTLFLQIIDGLDDIELAYRGTKNADKAERRENYFLLISQYKDKDKNTINVPIYINEKGQYNRVFIDTNKIATVFGRDNFNDYIRKELENGNLVRIKRNTRSGELAALIAESYGKSDSNSIIRQKPAVSQAKNEKNFKSTDEDTSVTEKTKQTAEKIVKDIQKENPNATAEEVKAKAQETIENNLVENVAEKVSKSDESKTQMEMPHLIVGHFFIKGCVLGCVLYI